MFSNLWLIICWNFILIVFTKDRFKWKLCEYATPKKYIGYYDFTIGVALVRPFFSKLAESKKICNEDCRINDNCYATSFDTRNNCSFFHTNNFPISYIDGKQFSLWIPCNMSDGDQPNDGRCKGLWVSYIDHVITINGYANLETLYTKRTDCRERCLSNTLCGFINTDDEHCSLISKWPYLNINITKKANWTIDKWTCEDNFVQNLNIEKIQYQPSLEKCTGYWEISNRTYSLDVKHASWLKFQTQIHIDCIEECDQYPECSRVYYDVTYSFCVLDHVESSEKLPFSKNILVIVFDWTCLRNDSLLPAMNVDEKNYENMGMNCYKIVNTEHLFIGMDNCGKCSSKSTFVQCSEAQRGYNWGITDSCMVNQSYWAFPSETILVNDTSGQKLWKVVKIFTGLQLYWLTYLSNNNNLLKVNFIGCRIFNASRSVEILNPSDIISRHDWQALPQNGTALEYHIKPTKVVVATSHYPFHSCRTKAACTDILRWLQVLYFQGAGITTHFSDIPYNFMIDDEGNIYEARGWKKQCASVAVFNPETICIGYIGFFYFKLPGEKYLNGLKKFIAYAVDHGYLIKDYDLYIQQDLGISVVHRNLVISIKNWYRYRGFIPEYCGNISMLTICLNILFSLIIVLFLGYFYTVFTFRNYCAKCNFLFHKDLEFQKLLPDNDILESRYDLDALSCDSQHTIIYERPTWITGRIRLRTVDLIKFWFFRKYSDYFHGNTFYQYMERIRNDGKVNCSYVYETNFTITDGVDSTFSKVIICVPDNNSMVFLKGLLQNGSCLCHYFKMEHVDLPKLSIILNVMD